MEIVIGIVIGLAIGFFVGKLMEGKKAGEEKTQLIAKAQVLAANIDQSNQHHTSELQSLKAQMENERLFAEKLRAESDQQWAQKLETLKQEMHRMTIEQQKAAAEQLAAKQSALQENNRLQMDELLKPIKEQFADFKKSVEESKTQNEVNKKELQSTFEATMKLFQQEQQQAVTSLMEQTSKIGSDAANLTKALKGDSKMQGGWGEMVLETILENSGLRKDEEFFIQENTKDENGKNFRPDVIVRFPEGRSVVIDSKVSLTAYTDGNIFFFVFCFCFFFCLYRFFINICNTLAAAPANAGADCQTQQKYSYTSLFHITFFSYRSSSQVIPDPLSGLHQHSKSS